MLFVMSRLPILQKCWAKPVQSFLHRKYESDPQCCKRINRRRGYLRTLTCALPVETAEGLPCAGGRTAEAHESFTYVSTNNRWHIRSVDKTSPQEIARIVALQTEGFYEKHPFSPLDQLFRQFFEAEVLAEMMKKVQFNPVDRFVLLVVEDVDREDAEIVGAMEISWIDIQHVLDELNEPGVTAVPYLASMAVDPSFRRSGAATALLEAAESLACLVWEEPRAVLHVYQDNEPAIELYKRRGYEIVFADAGWWKRLGARPRFLMRKQLCDIN